MLKTVHCHPFRTITCGSWYFFINDTSWYKWYQVGPQPVANGNITPINGRKFMGIWCYNPTYGSYNCIYNWIRGPPCISGHSFDVFGNFAGFHEICFPARKPEGHDWRLWEDLTDWVSSYSLNSFLGGGFKYFLFSPIPDLGKWSNLTIIFFKGVETTN